MAIAEEIEPGLTSRVADFVAGLRYDDLPDAVRLMALRHVLDTVGCIVWGSTHPSSRALHEVARQNFGEGRSTILGIRDGVTPLEAALANGTQGDVAELGDRHTYSGMHPGPVVLPTALALAEQLNMSGRDLLTACVAGYEVSARIGMAVRPESFYRGWYSSGTFGTFGATAAAANLLRLDRDQALQALGLAGSRAMSPVVSFRSDGKYIAIGTAAMLGVLNAELAQRGVTGGTDMLEGRTTSDPYAVGFLALARPDAEPDLITDGLGSRFEIMNCSIKPYACAGDMHSAMDAVMLLRAEGLNPDQVDAIHIGSFCLVPSTFDIQHPANHSEAILSCQHAVAVALLEGSCMPVHFEDHWINEPRIIELRGRMSLSLDPEVDAFWPLHRAAKVTVQARGGIFEKTVVESRGTFGNPLSDDDLANKFLGLTSPVIGTAAPRALELLRDLENLSNVRELTSLLIPN